MDGEFGDRGVGGPGQILYEPREKKTPRGGDPPTSVAPTTEEVKCAREAALRPLTPLESTRSTHRGRGGEGHAGRAGAGAVGRACRRGGDHAWTWTVAAVTKLAISMRATTATARMPTTTSCGAGLLPVQKLESSASAWRPRSSSHRRVLRRLRRCGGA